MSVSATTVGQRIAAHLPYPLPDCANARILLIAIRRMGAHGLQDAAAAQALLSGFGQTFQRPLTFVRVMMAEIAAASALPITIGPCCCPRTTAAERAILTIVARAETRPAIADILLRDMLGVRRADCVLASAAAVSAAFADAGRPIAG